MILKNVDVSIYDNFLLPIFVIVSCPDLLVV